LEFPEIYFTGLRLGLLNDSDAIIVNTYIEKIFLSEHAISKEKIHVIPPSVDPDYWSIKKKIDIRLDLSIESNSIILLFAGHRSPEKGIIFLIESLKKLLNMKIQVDLILIGSSTLEYQNYIKNQKIYVKKHIHDLGIVNEEEKKSIFNACDVFVLPSISESFGISFIESWICKKPVIGCDTKAIKEIIDNGENGFLVTFNDYKQLAMTIKKLVENQDLRKSLGDNGFRKVMSKYNSQKNLPIFEELCKSVTMN
jgi:glycosyltransferase involved in cell wall biosynthesis